MVSGRSTAAVLENYFFLEILKHGNFSLCTLIFIYISTLQLINDLKIKYFVFANILIRGGRVRGKRRGY